MRRRMMKKMEDRIAGMDRSRLHGSRDIITETGNRGPIEKRRRRMRKRKEQ